MRIGIDLDGVCYPFTETFQLWCETQRGWILPRATHWEFYRDWGYSTPEFLAEMNKAVEAGVLFHVGRPLSREIGPILTELTAEGHDIVLLSNRDPEHEPTWAATKAWVAAWRLPYAELTLTRDKTQHQLDVLLDDSPANIEMARKAGIRAVVFDQEWNWACGGPRAYTWQQVRAMVTK